MTRSDTKREIMQRGKGREIGDWLFVIGRKEGEEGRMTNEQVSMTKGRGKGREIGN